MKKNYFIDDNHFWIGAIEDEEIDGLWKWTSGYPNNNLLFNILNFQIQITFR